MHEDRGARCVTISEHVLVVDDAVDTLDFEACEGLFVAVVEDAHRGNAHILVVLDRDKSAKADSIAGREQVHRLRIQHRLLALLVSVKVISLEKRLIRLLTIGE